MSICTIIAANCPLTELEPSQDYPCHIDLDRNTIEDGGADDNFFLYAFPEVKRYCAMDYGVYLEWNYGTVGRARQIMDYIGDILEETEVVELWQVWLTNDEDERSDIKCITVPFQDLQPEDILELNQADAWLDRRQERPTWYCLRVIR